MKASLLFAAPVRFSKLLNVTPPTEPEPMPATVQVESAAGPLSVSVPPPPSNETGMPAEASEESIEKLSLPSPPAIDSPVTLASGLLVVVPSTVTSRFEPSTDAETVWGAPSASVTAHAAGGSAGVESLVVVVVVSGVVVASPAGAAGSVPLAAGSSATLDHSRPCSLAAGTEAVGSVGAAGAVAGVCAGAAGGGWGTTAVVTGICVGMPTVSSTVGALLNGSVAVEACAGGAGPWACWSVITWVRAGAVPAGGVPTMWWGSEGSGARR